MLYIAVSFFPISYFTTDRLITKRFGPISMDYLF